MPKKPVKKPKPRKPKPGGRKPPKKPRKPGGGSKPNPDQPARKRPGTKLRKPVRRPWREHPSGSIPLSCRNLRDEPLLLDCWLEHNPKVANAIRWERGKRGGGFETLAWPDWPASMKSRLRDAWMAARDWHAAGMRDYDGTPWTDPPPNQDADVDPPTTRTVLDGPTQARPWYYAQVGHCLAAEIEGWVPWSIRHYTVEQLEHLLAGPMIFVRDRDNATSWDADHPGGYIVGGVKSQEKATPSHPTFVYRFLATADLVGPTRLDTVGRVLDWCRAHLRHYFGSFTAANAEAHWQYRGWPPVRRVIEGTTPTDPGLAGFGHQHWTGGCWGTTAFLRSVLRSVNIPVLMLFRCGHALPAFGGIGRYLTHGDDPYNLLAQADYPAKELLITKATFDAWFPFDPADADNEADQATSCANIGRRPVDLAVWHFSDWLLDKHCADKAAGLAHADGEVFATFAAKGYTLAELESTDLWVRLDAAALERGLC